MRKFKVWCKDKQGWEEDKCFLGELGTIWHESYSGMIPLKKENHEIVFYTGLKDENGKEIYEGDIVKGEVGFRGKVMKVKGQVKYTHCRFVIAEWNCSLFQFSNDFAGGGFWIEKIGNKYEDSHLLEADTHD